MKVYTGKPKFLLPYAVIFNFKMYQSKSYAIRRDPRRELTALFRFSNWIFRGKWKKKWRVEGMKWKRNEIMLPLVWNHGYVVKQKWHCKLVIEMHLSARRHLRLLWITVMAYADCVRLKSLPRVIRTATTAYSIKARAHACKLKNHYFIDRHDKTHATSILMYST